MRTLTDKDKKHPIISALLMLGHRNIWLIYSPRLSPEWGWNLVQSTKGTDWLGYNTEAALKYLDGLTNALLCCDCSNEFTVEERQFSSADYPTRCNKCEEAFQSQPLT